MVALRHEGIGRLDVAVDETVLVGGIQRGGELRHQRERALGRERPLGREQPLEVDAVDVAHRDEELAAGLARLVDGDDAGVVDRGRRARLPQEAGHGTSRRRRAPAAAPSARPCDRAARRSRGTRPPCHRDRGPPRRDTARGPLRWLRWVAGSHWVRNDPTPLRSHRPSAERAREDSNLRPSVAAGPHGPWKWSGCRSTNKKPASCSAVFEQSAAAIHRQERKCQRLTVGDVLDLKMNAPADAAAAAQVQGRVCVCVRRFVAAVRVRGLQAWGGTWVFAAGALDEIRAGVGALQSGAVVARGSLWE